MGCSGAQLIPNLMEDELLWLLRDLGGLMRLLAVMGLYDLLMDELLWRTADPGSHGELL